MFIVAGGNPQPPPLNDTPALSVYQYLSPRPIMSTNQTNVVLTLFKAEIGELRSVNDISSLVPGF